MKREQEKSFIRTRAVTNEQKREVIEQLYNCWIDYPEFRLGQLIYNAFEDDLFYIPDSVFKATLSDPKVFEKDM